MPLIRRKIPGTKRVILIRYPKTLLPRLKKTPGPNTDRTKSAGVKSSTCVFRRDEEFEKELFNEDNDDIFAPFFKPRKKISISPA